MKAQIKEIGSEWVSNPVFPVFDPQAFEKNLDYAKDEMESTMKAIKEKSREKLAMAKENSDDEKFNVGGLADFDAEITPKLKAHNICQQAIETMVERGKTYDKDNQQEERSMGKTVQAFNALTGHNLTETQGWLFMATLKMARSQQGDYKADNFLDGTAYFALAGESASFENG